MKRKEILFLLISVFILVFAWIAFSIYHNSVTSTIAEPLGVQISPINPSFDNETFAKLKKRQKIQPLFEMQKTEEEKTATSSSSLEQQSPPPATQSATQETISP